MKLPASVGQKKAKAIEQLLKELDIGKLTSQKKYLARFPFFYT